eukprot:gene9452-1658_t
MDSLKWIIAICCLIIYSKSDCVHTSPDITYNGGASYPTVPNKIPIRLPMKHHKMLNEICQFDINQKVCCNTTQVENMYKEFPRISIVFFRCPACIWAIRDMFCENNCGLNQDKMVKIVAMKEPPYERFVENFTFSMTKESRRRIWEESCMDNIVGATSLRNQYPTAEDFFHGVFLVARTDPQIIFDMVPDNSRGYLGPIFDCKDSCRCSTCGKACGNMTSLQPDFECRVYGIQCPYAIMIAASTMLLLFFFTVGCVLINRLIVNIKSYLNRKDEYSTIQE